MLDFEAISKMNVNDWCNYIETLDTTTITTNRDLFNMIHGFILCREISRYNLPKETVDKIFYCAMLNNTMNSLENLYKK